MWKTYFGMWIIYVLVLLGLFLVIVPPVGAHDNWVSKGGYKNATGEWCCGNYDCKDGLQYSAAPLGWLLANGEMIPYEEGILDSRQKAVIPPMPGLTVCRRPDGSRRCVFGLKPSY